MTQKTCPSCQQDNAIQNNFCTQCGSKLIGMSDYQARLCILYGEPMGAVFLLRQGRTTIGHDSGNLVVLGDKLVSNKHAAISFDKDSYWIEDRESKNGVHVNGEKITEQEPLVDGSVIKLGSTILRFEYNNGSGQKI